MDGTKDCHTERNQAEKGKYHDTAYMWNLKKNGINELIYKTESHRCRKQTWLQKQKCWRGSDKLGGWH